MEELLNCSVCMDAFQGSGPRTPKMLPCQHSFCIDCLRNIHTGQTITCPACRVTHNLVHTDQVPNSFTLLQLIDWKESGRTDLECESCLQLKPCTTVLCQKCLDQYVDEEVVQTLRAVTKDARQRFRTTAEYGAEDSHLAERKEDKEHAVRPGTDSIYYKSFETIRKVFFMIMTRFSIFSLSFLILDGFWNAYEVATSLFVSVYYSDITVTYTRMVLDDAISIFIPSNSGR